MNFLRQLVVVCSAVYALGNEQQSFEFCEIDTVKRPNTLRNWLWGDDAQLNALQYILCLRSKCFGYCSKITILANSLLSWKRFSDININFFGTLQINVLSKTFEIISLNIKYFHS